MVYTKDNEVVLAVVPSSASALTCWPKCLSWHHRRAPKYLVIPPDTLDPQTGHVITVPYNLRRRTTLLLCNPRALQTLSSQEEPPIEATKDRGQFIDKRDLLQESISAIANDSFFSPLTPNVPSQDKKKQHKGTETKPVDVDDDDANDYDDDDDSHDDDDDNNEEYEERKMRRAKREAKRQRLAGRAKRAKRPTREKEQGKEGSSAKSLEAPASHTSRNSLIHPLFQPDQDGVRSRFLGKEVPCMQDPMSSLGYGYPPIFPIYEFPGSILYSEDNGCPGSCCGTIPVPAQRSPQYMHHVDLNYAHEMQDTRQTGKAGVQRSRQKQSK